MVFKVGALMISVSDATLIITGKLFPGALQDHKQGKSLQFLVWSVFHLSKEKNWKSRYPKQGTQPQLTTGFTKVLISSFVEKAPTVRFYWQEFLKTPPYELKPCIPTNAAEHQVQSSHTECPGSSQELWDCIQQGDLSPHLAPATHTHKHTHIHGLLHTCLLPIVPLPDSLFSSSQTFRNKL